MVYRNTATNALCRTDHMCLMRCKFVFVNLFLYIKTLSILTVCSKKNVEPPMLPYKRKEMHFSGEKLSLSLTCHCVTNLHLYMHMWERFSLKRYSVFVLALCPFMFKVSWSSEGARKWQQSFVMLTHLSRITLCNKCSSRSLRQSHSYNRGKGALPAAVALWHVIVFLVNTVVSDGSEEALWQWGYVT